MVEAMTYSKPLDCFAHLFKTARGAWADGAACFVLLSLLWSIATGCASTQPAAAPLDMTAWQRVADDNTFTTTHGNNHDAVLFVEPGNEYPYHLIISHTPEHAYLWRAKAFSPKSDGWELVADEYKIARHYEYDDGVKVGDTYFIFEAGKVYTYTGDLADSSGKWQQAGTFPNKLADDIGVYHDGERFHIYGEHGNFPHGPDGTSLAHLTSETGLGDWRMHNPKAVDANPDGGHTYGVGDATITQVDGAYYLFCDRESKGVPYRVTAWKSDSLDGPFTYLGVVIEPRDQEVDDWDNHRVQDADIAYIPELRRYVIVANMLDTDGNPGGDFPNMKPGNSRVIGVYYGPRRDE